MRVLLCDDHPFIITGISALLENSSHTVIGTAANGAVALQQISALRPDAVVLDVEMPVQTGLDVLRTLRNRADKRRVVLLTASLDDQRLMEAVQLNVDGILLKDGAEETLLRCLDEVERGGRWIEQSLLQRALDMSLNGSTQDPLEKLSPREKAITGLVAQGLKNREVGEQLGMSEGTVKVYLHRIYGKLGLSSRTELALRAQQGPT